jgi:hypothetical protein
VRESGLDQFSEHNNLIGLHTTFGEYSEENQQKKFEIPTDPSPMRCCKKIQYRITLGNKAYYAKQFFFKSRLVSKKSKLKLYWSIIRPIVTYACET